MGAYNCLIHFYKSSEMLLRSQRTIDPLLTDIRNQKDTMEKGSEADNSVGNSVVDKLSDLETSADGINRSEEMENDSIVLVKEKERRWLPRRKATLQHATDESDDSEDESERAKRKRAFRAFKEAKSSSKTKTNSRIKGRPKDDKTDESDDEILETNNKPKRNLDFIDENPDEVTSSDDSGPSFPRKRKITSKPKRIISDTDEGSEDQDDGEEKVEDEESNDSFIDDGIGDSDVNERMESNVSDEWADMLENLKRRGTKFDELNSQYEEAVEARQLGGYDLSDDEERENKYPPRLLVNLREAVEAASLDDDVDVPSEIEDNNKLIQRWEMYNVDETRDKDGECVCGRTGLRWLFFMRVKGYESWPFHTRIVGSECIRWFCRGNPKSAMVAFARFLKEGNVATYHLQLDTKCLKFTLGGNILPPFFRQHKEFHKSEYNLPIEIDEDGVVDIIVKPGTSGRVKDEAGKVLLKGGKYHLWLRPVMRPCKNRKQLPIIDFVLVKAQDLKDMNEKIGKEQTGKDFLK